jgi:hypothetical protein
MGEAKMRLAKALMKLMKMFAKGRWVELLQRLLLLIVHYDHQYTLPRSAGTFFPCSSAK